MLSLGAALEDALKARGIPVLRDEALHDYPSYNDSYISSRKSAQAYLDEYPSLCLVLDLHRDASSGKQQLRPLAQTLTRRNMSLSALTGPLVLCRRLALKVIMGSRLT